VAEGHGSIDLRGETAFSPTTALSFCNQARSADLFFRQELQAICPSFNLPVVHQIQDALVEVKASNQYRQCSHFWPNQLRRSTRSLRGFGNDIIKKD